MLKRGRSSERSGLAMNRSSAVSCSGSGWESMPLDMWSRCWSSEAVSKGLVRIPVTSIDLKASRASAFSEEWPVTMTVGMSWPRLRSWR